MSQRKYSRTRVGAAVLVCHAIVCMHLASACIAGNVRTYERIRTKIDIGQSKESIRAALGKPDAVTNTGKTNRFIWGPEEEFWDKIPMGTKMEVWMYQLSDGSLKLYFVDGSEKLNYMAFAPRGRVY